MRIWCLPRGRAHLGAVAAAVLALTLQACGSTGPVTRGPVTRGPVTSGVTSSYFGMHAPSLVSTFPQAPVGAVNLTTNGVYWRDVEPTDGRFDFSLLTTLVDQAHAHGAQPLLILGLTPAFASTKPGASNVAATMPRLDQWRDYVHAVVTRYGTRVDYQIWPEADIASNWSGSLEQLATLVATAATIIHAATDDKALVVSPAMVLRLPYQQRAMRTFFAQKVGGTPVGDFVDVVGVDPYPLERGAPEDSATLIGIAHEILRADQVHAPLWNVEISYGVAGAHAPVHPLPASEQASYVVRTFLLNAANDVRRVYWLGWAQIAELGIQLVKPDQVTPSPAGQAYAMVRSWMIGQTVRSCQRRPDTDLYACEMVRDGVTSWVYWTTEGTERVVVPSGSRYLQRILAKPTEVAAGDRIVVTTTPVRAYG